MKKDSHSEWVSLREAANILGVHPATVRNWADRGGLPAQRTPGGHRRFRRSDLQRWSATRQEVPSAEARLLTQNALNQARLIFATGAYDGMDWYQHMDGTAKERLRTKGRQLFEQFQRHLASPNPASTQEVLDLLAREYVTLFRDCGLSLPQTGECCLLFLQVLHEDVLNFIEVTGQPPSLAWVELIRRMHTFARVLLFNMIEVYAEAEATAQESADEA